MNKCPYFYSNFFVFDCFDHHIKMLKNKFPIVFLKSDFGGGGGTDFVT